MWGRANSFYNVNSYNQAKSTYNNTQPLRGWPADADRPLERRSKDARQWICKRGEDYVVRMYRTDIVTYRADGSVLLNSGGYVTASTSTGISASSPFSCWCRGGELRVVVNGMRFVLPRAGLEIRVVDGAWSPVNPPVATQKKTRVRKDKAKVLRKYFKPVAQYIRALSEAFEGGSKPEYDHWSLYRDVTEVLTDDVAVSLAWRYVPTGRSSAGKDGIQSTWKAATAHFWKEVYREFEVIERYAVELPYGEVGK